MPLTTCLGPHKPICCPSTAAESLVTDPAKSTSYLCTASFSNPGVSNRTKSNQKSIEPNRTAIVRLGSVIEQNRTSILL